PTPFGPPLQNGRSSAAGHWLGPANILSRAWTEPQRLRSGEGTRSGWLRLPKRSSRQGTQQERYASYRAFLWLEMESGDLAGTEGRALSQTRPVPCPETRKGPLI